MENPTKLPTKLPTQFRTARIELDSGSRAESSDDRIPIALSSEAPVARWFGTEILDHDAKSIDLSRAEGGLPLLDNHDAYSSVTRQIGVIEDVEIGKDRVIRGKMRFSQRAEAQAIKQDVIDGIIRGVSIGYRIDELVLEKTDKKAGDTYRATKWQPLEGSLVSVPADQTVGVGRSADQDAHPVVIRTLETAPKAEEEVVEDTNTAAATNGAATVGADRSAEFIRTQELTALAGVTKRDADLAGWIRSGKSVDAIRTELLVEMNRNLENVRTPAVDLTEKEKKQYSLMRAVAAEIRQDWRGAEFEREVSDAIAAKMPSSYQRRGNFFMPTNVGTRTALSVDGAGTGSETVFDEPGSFIEMLRNRMKVKELGATMLSGLRGPVAFPKQSGAGSTQWLGESAQVTESNLSTAQVLLNPRTLRARQSYTKQLFLEGVVDAENLVRNDLAAIMALEIDRAAINGSGAANEPLGILNTTGIGSVAIGASGGAPTYAFIVDLETEIAQDNADIGSMAYLTTAVMRGKLKKVEQFSTTNGMPVWTGGREGEMNGYAAHVSNQVPNTLVKGGSSDCHAIIFGAWNQLLIGEWGALEIQVDPYTRADYGEVVLRTFQMCGLAVRYPEAFAAIKDARNV